MDSAGASIDYRGMHTLKGTIRGTKSSRDDTNKTAATPPPHGMVRSRERIAGGVAAGLARHFNLDPLVPRIGFVLLTVFAGAGALLYVLAWLALPSEDGPSRLESAFGGEPRRGAVAIIGLGLLAVGGAILVARLPGLAGPELSVAVYLIGLGLGALWWRRGATRTSGRAPARAPTAQSGHPRTPRASTPTAEPSPAGDRGGRSLAWATLGALGVIAGIGALIATQDTGLGAQTALAAALILVGGGLVASAYLGRAPGLATIGVTVASGVVLLAAIGVPLSGGFGEARWAPADVDALRGEYRFAAGDAVLDLRDLDLPAGRHDVAASVAMGNLEVRVPDDVDLTIEGRVSAGDVDVLGQRDDGVGVEVSTSLLDDHDATLDLSLDVGLGALQVR